ncbi:MAG TPA: TolC family protein [Steroidobacteraceae bacterium]|jgi:outer membrane protein TolC
MSVRPLSALRCWGAVVPVALAAACAGAPQRARPDPTVTAQSFQARRLDQAPDLPPASAGWDRAQWLEAALTLNPQLAEARARATAVAAGELTARQIPNPTLNLFDEYVTAAAGGAAWLYGLSVDFLLQRPGERARARNAAALQTLAAQSDVAESIWQVRAQVRQALLDAVRAQDEVLLLQQLLADRQGLLASARARAQAGEVGATEIASATLELTAAQQRLDQARARGADAQTRLAVAVGVPTSALEEIPLQWPQWADINALSPSLNDAWREQALVARPDLVRTLREYDLAENTLRSEVARRWPAIHLEPGYAWDRGGVHENQLNENLRDNELGLSMELPIFNRNQGPIGEAVARRELAARHLVAVQAQLLGEIERAERAWPRAREGWQNAVAAAATAQRQSEAEQRSLKAGASDRPSALAAHSAALDSQLLVLQSAYEAQSAFAALEDAYRRPLQGPECALPMTWRSE